MGSGLRQVKAVQNRDGCWVSQWLGTMTIRTLLLIVFAFALGTISCSKRGVEFQQGGVLSAAEQENAAKRIDPYFASWRPHYSAQWNDKDIQRRVYLGRNDISSIAEHYQVLVFDGLGHLLEANYVEISNMNLGPKALISISPLCVEFVFPGGKRHRAGIAYSEEEGMRLLKQYGQESKAALESLGHTSSDTHPAR